MQCIGKGGAMKDQGQITVRLPRDLQRALREAADRTNRKRSEIVRMAVREYLGLTARRQGGPPDGVRALIGSIESGIPDLAENHRKYVLEALTRGG
jgi:predicted transcriptional regulator